MILNKSDFRANLLILFTNCASLLQIFFHTSLSASIQYSHSQDSSFHDSNIQIDDVVNSLDEDSMLSKLYKKLITFDIEKSNFIACFNKTEKDQEEFKDVISFVLDSSMPHNYDIS